MESWLVQEESAMPKQKFIIEPHFRLQEWVAEEKGYFNDEGLAEKEALLENIVGPKGRVFTVDIDPEMASRARAALKTTRTKVVTGDGRDGYGAGASRRADIPLPDGRGSDIHSPSTSFIVYLPAGRFAKNLAASRAPRT